MLPDITPEYANAPEFDIFATMTPAHDVGGNFYDFFSLDDNRILFLIGDVCARGVGAALFMATAKTMVHMQSQHGGTPGEIITHVNRKLFETNEENMAVGVFLAVVDLCSGLMTYSNAGQEDPVILSEDNVCRIQDDNEGKTPPLGREKSFVYKDRSVMLNPGDKVFLYTDGLINVTSRDGTEYGYEKLIRSLTDERCDSCEKMCDMMIQSAVSHLEGQQQVDDFTVLGFAFNQKKVEEEA